MGDSTIIIDFLIASKTYDKSIKSKLDSVFDEVIISNISNHNKDSYVVIDNTAVSGDVIMEDMPLRVSMRAQNTIDILLSKIDFVKSLGSSMVPLFIQIIDNDMGMEMNASLSSNNYVEFNVVAQEEKRTAIEAYLSTILISTNTIECGYRLILSHAHSPEIAIVQSDVLSRSYITSSLKSNIEFNIDQNQIARSSFDVDECTISFVGKSMNALVGYFRTIDDIKAYTISNLDSMSLAELFFTEVG